MAHNRGFHNREVYAEGRCTPAITFATPGDLSVAYSTQLGSWVRIGNFVTVAINLVTSSFTFTTASGSLSITGLPFAPRNITGDRHIGAVIWGGITKTNYTAVVASLTEGFTNFNLVASGSGQASSAVTAADMPSAGSVVIRLTVSYLI